VLPFNVPSWAAHDFFTEIASRLAWCSDKFNRLPQNDWRSPCRCAVIRAHPL
jgi:hypothetical protein